MTNNDEIMMRELITFLKGTITREDLSPWVVIKIKKWILNLENELNVRLEEKIRQALIKYHKSTISIDGIRGIDIVAWLEKQEKKRPTSEYQV